LVDSSLEKVAVVVVVVVVVVVSLTDVMLDHVSYSLLRVSSIFLSNVTPL
jgi:hypothetical protein